MNSITHNMKLYDSYRGLAAIVVFISHLYYTFFGPYIGSSGALMNTMGLLATWSVNIFFILSGYLITYSILRNISKNGYFKWQDFMISRIARIYPPLIASIILSILLYWIVVYFGMHGKYSFRLPGDLYLIRENFSLAYREILDSLLMRGGLLLVNGVLWSLYIEVKIYLVAMLIAILIKGNIGSLGKFVAFVTLITVSWELLDSFVFVIIWCLGSVFVFTSQEGELAVQKRIMNFLYVCALVVFIYYLPYPMTFMQNNRVINGFLATVSLSFLFTGLIFKWQAGAKILQSFGAAAKYSYTLYLIHFPLLLFAFSLTHQMLSSEFNYGKLLVTCALVFIAILFTASITASFFEDKSHFEDLIRNMLHIHKTKSDQETQ